LANDKLSEVLFAVQRFCKFIACNIFFELIYLEAARLLFLVEIYNGSSYANSFEDMMVLEVDDFLYG